jgi:tripartite-type tricarboxylate transporter receptor subunit TctC
MLKQLTNGLVSSGLLRKTLVRKAIGRTLHWLAAALALGLSASAVSAQSDYPSRAITLIVPFAAGGPTDVIARIAGEHMSRTLGQQIVIENVLGAGGTTASTRAMRANPDGYTIHHGAHGHARRFGRALSQSRL